VINMNGVSAVMLILALTLSCKDGKFSDDKYSQNDKSGYSQFDFDESELHRLESRVKSGDNDALQKLVDHYLFSSNMNAIENRKSAINWLKIGVERKIKGHIITFLSIVRDGESDCEFVNSAISSLNDHQALTDILEENDFVRSCREAAH
jgi:hypothetical protein